MGNYNFWDNRKLEPKRKFRWLVTFADMPQFIAKSVTKPSFSIGKSQHQYLQHNFNFPGRVTWNPVTIQIVDPVDPDATQSLYDLLLASGYVLPTDVQAEGGGGHRTINKEDMVNKISDVRIETLGSQGKQGDGPLDGITETWVLNNPIITSVNFDTLDYGSDELLNISMEISYDWATLNPQNEDNRERTWLSTGPARATPNEV